MYTVDNEIFTTNMARTYKHINLSIVRVFYAAIVKIVMPYKFFAA